MKKYFIIIIFIILGLVGSIYFIIYLKNRIPLYSIALKENTIDFTGWELYQYYEVNLCLKYYFFKKEIKDTSIYFSFYYYFDGNKKCGFKSGLGDYNLNKEFHYHDSICTLSLNLNGDTLFLGIRDTNKMFFSPDYGKFYRGKYYYYYNLKKSQLDSCQVKYFQDNEDSLIKTGTNYIPEFDDNCKILKFSNNR